MAAEPVEEGIEELEINIDDLSIGDLMDIEEHTGIDMVNGFDESKMSLKLIAVLVWVTRRHTNPAYTLADARNEKLSVFSGLAKPANPTPAPEPLADRREKRTTVARAVARS